MFCKRLGLKFFPLFTGWWGSEEALITLIKSARLGDWIPDSNRCWWSMHIKAIWHEAILIWLTDLSWLSALQIKVRLVCNCTYKVDNKTSRVLDSFLNYGTHFITVTERLIPHRFWEANCKNLSDSYTCPAYQIPPKYAPSDSGDFNTTKSRVFSDNILN